ncbi:MAG: cytochrome c [Myxococcaceae bacterium]|nr:cytochrome c [Myxococcaceae bacterium]
MNRPTILALTLAAASGVFFAACTHDTAASAPAESASATSDDRPATTASRNAPAPATVADQIALGGQLYGENCAGCHGAAGEGKKAPPVVGANALPLDPPATAKYRTVPFKTAWDVGSWVVQNMPPKKGGSLTADQYLAILAFDLKANGVELEEPLTVEKAQAIVLHP